MAPSLEQLAYQSLRKDLLHGRIHVGQVVSENAMAKQIGISRTPVRHAMRQLANEGVFVPLAHVGAVVKVPSPREIEEIFALRQLLECEAAGLAARHITPQQAAELGQVAHRYREAILESCEVDSIGSRPDLEIERARIDLLFHYTILRIAGNRQLARVVNASHLQTRTRIPDVQQGVTQAQVKAKLLATSREHVRISNAIRRKNEDAARAAMAEHLQSAKASYQRLLQAAMSHGCIAELSPAVKLLLSQQESEPDLFLELLDEPIHIPGPLD